MGEINRGLLDYYAGNKFTFYQLRSTANEDRTCSFDVIFFFKLISISSSLKLYSLSIVHHVSALTPHISCNQCGSFR